MDKITRMYGRMIKMAICDDDSFFIKYTKGILTDYFEEKGVFYEIDEFKSGKDFIGLGIEIVKYKIVFLDINMDEFDGIRTAQKIREISTDIYIAFITAFTDYAIEGYKVDAIRYIMKNNDNFFELVYECMDAVIMKMNYVINTKVFHFNEGTKRVSLERILYIESKLHKLEFYVMEDELNKYTLYGTLNNLEKELEGDSFLRIHQSYLVNMKHIKNIRRYETVMTNGEILKIPKVRFKVVEEKYVSYKGER